MNALERLWDSTAALYERFGLDTETTPPSKRRRIFMEEVAELLEESAWDDASHPSSRRSYEVCSEAADVVVTVMGLLQAHDVKLEDFAASMERIAAKNDAKTADTHLMANGKITRKAS